MLLSSAWVGGDTKTVDLARNFVNTTAKIEVFIAAQSPPFIAKVYRPSPVSAVARGMPGSVQLQMDYAGWLKSRKSIGYRP